MKEIRNQITAALQTLGYTVNDDSLSVVHLHFSDYIVTLNREYIGVWNADRHTFVD